jgi:hypothetical protein
MTEPTPFEKFREFVRKVVSVPKSEIDRREVEYKRMRKQKRAQRQKGSQ